MPTGPELPPLPDHLKAMLRKSEPREFEGFAPDATTPTADRDDLAAIGQQIIADYALDHESLHANWRCEHPDVYGPCGCVDEFLTSLASMVLESDWLRGIRAKELRDAADAWNQGQWSRHYGIPKQSAPAVENWLRDRADRVERTATETTRPTGRSVTF